MTTDPTPDRTTDRTTDRTIDRTTTRTPVAGLGALGRRLVLAFVAVTALAVALVTAGALVGTDQGLAAQLREQHRQLTDTAARTAAEAYAQGGSWAAVDPADLRSVTGSGTGLSILDADGAVVISLGMGRRGAGAGMGPGQGQGQEPTAGGADGVTAGGETVSAPVLVGDVEVGTLTLYFPATTVVPGRPVAWRWVLVAALLALIAAAIAGVVASRTLTRPVTALITASRAHAAGDLSARVAGRGVGELGELADAFDEAAGAVQNAEAARRQMAADVAHELRTPLAALQAGLEEVRDGLAPADGATLSRLHDQSLRLARVVTDLADLSSAQAAGHTLRLERIDLADLVRQECEARAAQLRSAELDLRVEADAGAVVQGDASRLHQVVGNLLENCVRHCRPGDTVSVRVTRTAGRARLVVSDTGPGIDEADLPQVLTRFWRSPRARTASIGSGLGLAIVAEIVQAHHGRIEVTSPGHQGTTVVVEMPGARA